MSSELGHKLWGKSLPQQSLSLETFKLQFSISHKHTLTAVALAQWFVLYSKLKRLQKSFTTELT